MIMRYFGTLPLSKTLLWCYLIWYLVIASLYFSGSPEIWLNSLGLALVVGYALFLSTGPGTLQRFKQRFWESCRLFLCPFLVSSFSSLVKGKGFVLLLSPHWDENLMAVGFCVAFCVFVRIATGWQRKRTVLASSS